MNNRLQQFLELENLTPARLADTLGVQRSGLSHILSGRNKPGFDFITKLLTKFPHINSEWLIMGKGKPYKEMMGSQTASSSLPSNGSKNFHQGKNPNSFPDGNNHIMYNSILYDSIQNNDISYSGLPYNDNRYNGIQNNGISDIDVLYNGIQNENSMFKGQESASFPEAHTAGTEANTAQSADNMQNISQNTPSQPSENRVNGLHKALAGQKKRIKRVIVFYSDGSFEELFPHIG